MSEWALRVSDTVPRVRLYGDMTGEHSFAQVTRGMGVALSAAGELAGSCPVDQEQFDDGSNEWMSGQDAPIALNCGSPMALMHAHRMGQHKSHWLLLAPNGESLPDKLVEALTMPSEILPRGLLTGGLLTPSAWAANVLRRLFPDRPIVVAPHGVSPDVHKTDREAREAARVSFRLGQFNVLHMTSSETERKSTKFLLRAWKQAKDEGFLPKQAKLFVMMNPLHLNKIRWWSADFGLTDDDVLASPGLTYDQHGVAALYGSMHAICQPSRGEGFGLVPLEALACGVPIIATACTGHSECLGSSPPGAVIVEHGPLASMDDFAGSMAPTVTVAAIRDALAKSYAYWGSFAENAEQNAEAIAREWSWENKNVPAVRRMIQEAERHV